jgi:uncharacterized membrane protein
MPDDPARGETADDDPPAERTRDLFALLESQYRGFEPTAREWWLRGLGFFGPLILFLAPILFLGLLAPELMSRTLGFYPLAVIAGVDVSILTGTGLRLEWWYVLAWVVWGQMLLTAFMLWNLRFLRRWRRADRFFTRQEHKARKAYARHEWLRRFHFWGLAVFTLLPVGSGVYVGVILGKLTGLADLKTWTALMIGTVLWATILAYGGTHAWDLVTTWFD